MRYVRLAILYVIAAIALFALSNPQKASASIERQDDYKCVFLSDTLTIPDDGSWLPICLVDPSAPEGTTVTEMNVKMLVEHPDPSQLEIRLTRTDSDIEVPLSSTEITKEGVGSFTQIHDFDGSPSEGEWVVLIRDTQLEIDGGYLMFLLLPYIHRPRNCRSLFWKKMEDRPPNELQRAL